jgi:pimeloyl-ACP methyl ester carboxylesterase
MNVVYLHGFASGQSSSKAQFFARKFSEVGIPIDVPDLAAGDFEHLTITNQLAVIDRVVAGRPATLMGSSLGGYLAALYAARHPNIERLILMAPAFGFARHWAQTLEPEVVAEWARTGKRRVYHYAQARECDLSYELMIDAAQYEDYPDLQQPTLIFHGGNDAVVPFGFSERFVSLHPSAEVVLLDSGHELTDVVEQMWQETARYLGIEGGRGCRKTT